MDEQAAPSSSDRVAQWLRGPAINEHRPLVEWLEAMDGGGMRQLVAPRLDGTNGRAAPAGGGGRTPGRSVRANATTRESVPRQAR